MQDRSCELCNRRKAKCKTSKSEAPVRQTTKARVSAYNKKTKGDKKLPRCTRCERSDSQCSYPSRRKRPTFHSQYRSFRQRLLTENHAGELDELLDELDPETLQNAVYRRLSRSCSGYSPASSASPQAVKVSESQSLSPGKSSHSGRSSKLTSKAPKENILSENLQSDFGVWSAGPDWQSQGANIPGANLDGTYSVSDVVDWQSEPVNRPFDLGFDVYQSLLHPLSAGNYPVSNSGSNGDTYCLMAPPEIVDNLINLFFEKVSGFIPLLHADDFRAKYQSQTNRIAAYDGLNLEEALTLESMMALSARFSTAAYFEGVPPISRGRFFASRAHTLYQQAVQPDKLDDCNLSLLQGCILLAFYQQTCRPTTQSWIIIGTCCRLALELELDRIDNDILSSGEEIQLSSDEWSHREELRRAWWLVWELDTFASTILCRPHSIDKCQMRVLLPVSDCAWFSNTLVRSCSIISDPFRVWKTLKNCDNQDERAWFLVSSFLMATSHDLTRRASTTNQELEDFETSLNCFSLLLPPKFNLGSGLLSFDDTNFANGNWVIQTIFMLRTARLLLHQAKGRARENDSVVSTSKFHPESAAENTPSEDDDAHVIFRAIQSWIPEYIAFSCPFVVCTLIGPALDNVRAADRRKKRAYSTARGNLWPEMLKLVLRRIGNFWEIGSAALELVEMLETEQRCAPCPFDSPKFKSLARSFTLLLPEDKR